MLIAVWCRLQEEDAVQPPGVGMLVLPFVRYVDRHRTHLFDDVIYLKTEKQGIPIEIAVMYNTDYSENIHSYEL